MSSHAADYVTLAEIFELTASREEFEAVVSAAVRRLETEGIQKLIMVQFYAGPQPRELGAVLTFSDRNRMMDHVRMISGWPEFAQLLRVVRPVEVRVYGNLPPDVEAWMKSMTIPILMFDQPVAGFVR